MKNKFRVWDTRLNQFCSLVERIHFTCDEWVVQQCTGILDKNNKEIFEGDILFGETRNDPKIPTFTGIVEFHQPTASFLIRSEDGFTRGLNSLYNPEVKGNIYGRFKEIYYTKY